MGPPVTTNTSASPNFQQVSIDYLDSRYRQIECLGSGTFGSVYLALESATSQQVAVKCIRLNHAMVDSCKQSFLREIRAVVELNNASTKHANEDRDLSIIFFREWFLLNDNSMAFIVMDHIAGGTLAEYIRASENISERRIAWYILQLCDALAYAHEHGVSHYDVKPDNILIQDKDGGRLVVTDFGTSVRHDDTSIVGLTHAYAAPELLATNRTNRLYSLLDSTAIDSFGIGCVGLELVCGCCISEIPSLHGMLIGDYLTRPFKLEDVSPHMSPTTSKYSSLLRQDIIGKFLSVDPVTRARPSVFSHALRYDQNSPLLVAVCNAAFTPIPGHSVTMDNCRLGLFVQPGPDWPMDEPSAIQSTSVGIVTRLDPDALYTNVTWANGHTDTYRVGAKNKYELIVGPLFLDNLPIGLLGSSDISKYRIGEPFAKENHPANQMIVVGIAKAHESNTNGSIFLAPPWLVSTTTGPSSITCQPFRAPPMARTIRPRDAQPPPAFWHDAGGTLVIVTEATEMQFVFSLLSPLIRKGYRIQAVQRVQSKRLWHAYARRREDVAHENWGFANELRLFHGTSQTAPETIIHDAVGFDPRFCDKGAFGRGSYFAVDPIYSDHYRHVKRHQFQMFLALVTLGRIQQHSGPNADKIRRPESGYHSVQGKSRNRNRSTSDIHILYDSVTQAYPEYLITYTK